MLRFVRYLFQFTNKALAAYDIGIVFYMDILKVRKLRSEVIMCPYFMGMLEYTIQPFDNYWELARRFNTSVQGIMMMNPGVDPNNLLVGQVICIPLTSPEGPPVMTSISPAEAAFRCNMRLLWQEHISWARMVMVSLAYDLPDQDAVISRLLQNPVDMGNILRPLYGDYIADQYTGLIKEHLELAAELITTLIAGDKEGAAAIEKTWYANGAQVSEFLSSINPYLSKQRFREMFYSHLALTQTEAAAVINKDFKKDIETFNMIAMEAQEMADMISDAIIKQYTGLFR